MRFAVASGFLFFAHAMAAMTPGELHGGGCVALQTGVDSFGTPVE
jgi:hypothetical protein